ncbi:hypothetical protein K8O68_15295 [Salipaludibacillus sp. CUR1]|uniref:hypothetical protein n=1 Tax=Salipaludibacillus sp. CUR1 TaxID=2820003 RepID=UPI001E439EC9|nr:hypothetical protein [Salipaludibacillus sp. CUR1]MCE7793788.1 hypothetical protein [Salipaludibacillus sp. CUR1]
MGWALGIGFGVFSIIWLAMEIATYEDKGRNARYHFKIIKRSLLLIIPLFAIAGVVYYIFLN